jgi:hypothetical protein
MKHAQRKEKGYVAGMEHEGQRMTSVLFRYVAGTEQKTVEGYRGM